MACSQLNAATTEVDENITLALKEPSPSALGEASPPFIFSQLTPAQLGISTQSFSSSASNCKDKSRLAQLKARRRSAIGTRGSPETNALIRYIAQQRIKTLSTPERPNGNPFLPRVSSTRKQKMALFQMVEEENEEESDLLPRQDSETGGCKTRDVLSNGRSLDVGKENCPLHVTPPPSKRRCVGSPIECVGEIKEATTPIFKHTRCIPQKVDKEPRGDDSSAFLFFSPLRFESRPAPLRALQHAPPTHRSPNKTQQEGSFELQSPSQPQPEDPAASLMPSLLEMKSTGESNSSGNPEENTVTRKKKKQVRFGGLLLPELFDRTLPPCTPLQKGGTPARAPTSAGGSQLRSLLKTPQRSESRDPVPQPDFGSPFSCGASPVFLLRRKRRTPYKIKDDQEVCGEMDEIDCSSTDSSEGSWGAQPLDLSSAFQEESLNETLSLTGATPEPEACTPEPEACTPEPEACTPEPEACTPEPEACTPKPEACTPEPESTLEPEACTPEPAVPSEPPQIEAPKEAEAEPITEAPAPVRSSRRKRKQPEEEAEPVKRSLRSAAVKMKTVKKKTTSKRQWGAKEVDRSLFGSRVYASKNPTLSPVTECLASASCTPSPHQPRTRGTAQEQQPCLTSPSLGEIINGDPVTGVVTLAAQPHSCSSTIENIQETDDIVTTDTCEVPSEVPLVFSGPDKQEVARKGRRRSGPKGTGGAARGRRPGKKVLGPIDAWLGVEPQHRPPNGGRLDENREIQTTTNADSTESSPSKNTVPENGEVDTEDTLPQPPVDAQSTDTNEKAECPTSLDASTTHSPPLDIEIANTVSLSEQESLSHMESIQNQAMCGRPRGRLRACRSAINDSLLDERDDQAGQQEMEKGQCDPAGQVETNSGLSRSDSQPEEATKLLDLVPWQAEFNMEDVFKPVATRGRRSVRRSLRNQVRSDDPSSINASGMAWLPCASPPNLIRKVRRSGRVQPPLPEKPDQ